MLDLVVLTDPRYVAPENPTLYDLDVIKEDQLVMEACAALGLSVDRKSWDDPHFQWSETKAVIFRTTWDYFDRYDEFKQWMDKARLLTKFINPQELVFWNVDKQYLLDLEAKGIRIVPTYIVALGSKENLKNIADQKSWQEVVIKPTISATARDTHLLTYKELKKTSTHSMFNALCSKKTMMVQPFLRRVLDDGELSVIVIDGKVTHGVRKIAKSGDYRVQSDFGGRIHLESPDPDTISFAENVVRACPEMPLYARVDLIKDHEGRWNLGEMELIEPELWFRLHPEAAKQLAFTIQHYLEK